MVKKILFSFFLINLFGVLNTYAMDVNITPSSGTWYNNSNESVSTSNPTSRYIGSEPFFQFSSSNTYSQFMSTDVYFDESINSYLLSNRWDVSFTILSYGDYNIRLGTSSCFITSSTDMTNMDSNSAGDFDVSNAYYSYKNVFCPNVQLNSVPVKLRLYRTFSTSDQTMNRLLLTQYWSFSQTNNSNTNQDIIDNQNQNTQDVIDNQNQNTQQEIEIQKVCQQIDKSSIVIPNKYLNGSGVETETSIDIGITDYININGATINKIVGYVNNNNQITACFYNVNKVLISCQGMSTQTGLLTIPSNSYYFRSSIYATSNKPQYEICKNGNQALTDSLTSEETPNTNSDINDMNDMVASDTPISDLITMPLTLINAYMNGVNASCSPVNLGNLYGTDLILPCINLEQRLGSNLWHIIDALFSIFMCYNIGMLFVSAFDGLTSLRDDFEGLYQPRHADNSYQPRHGG